MKKFVFEFRKICGWWFHLQKRNVENVPFPIGNFEFFRGLLNQEWHMVKSVRNALKVLDYILERHVDGKDATLGEISSHIGLRNTTVRNMLKTMEECGYLSRGAGRSYALGPKCLDIKRVGSGAAKLAENARAALAALAERIGESVVLTTMISGKRKVLLRIDGGNVISVDSSKIDIGGAANYSLVTNRLMLAYASPSELEKAVERNGLPKPGEWKGVESYEDLIVELRKIRALGYSEVRGENLSSVAFPLLSHDSTVIAAVGVYAPSYRYDDDKAELIKNELKEAVSKITAASPP